ncbi:glycosyltransferase family 4 protein, partial [Nostoc sp. NIES-2111]
IFTSLPQAFNGKKPDLILLTIPPLLVSLPATLLSWIYQCPVVLNVQDILPEAAVRVGLMTNKLMIRFCEIIEKFAYKHATKISVIAEGFRDNLIGKGVSAKKITCIPNWVNVNFIRPLAKKNAWRTAHQLDNKFVVMYSGNIALTQGLETVIAAAAYLRHIPDISFVIIGESTALSRLQKYCLSCGADNVLLLPLQPREQLPQTLAAADVSLVVQKSNVIAFNMPSKIPLALASGRPIVGSVPAIGTAAKVIRESGGGIIVEPESPEALAAAVLEIYKNPTLAAKLGYQGRKFAEEYFSFEQAIEQYEDLFFELLGKKRIKLAPVTKLSPPESVKI